MGIQTTMWTSARLLRAACRPAAVDMAGFRRHIWAKTRSLCGTADLDKVVKDMADKATISGGDTPSEESPVPEAPAETVTGDTTSHSFEAETKQLLEIVANSLYTDKEVFVRELISNASDALEKRRYLQLTSSDASAADAELQVSITCDVTKRLLVIQDSGVGMKKEELVENLGCIARSGSKAFMQQLSGNSSTSEVSAAASNIIGRFGVGFYSVFMVADSVRVFSRHTQSEDPNAEGWCWQSTGDGSYSLARATNVKTGTKIEITLKEGASEFASRYNLERIIRKHSSFVTFPVLLHGERLNNLEPVWAKPKAAVTAEEHQELYQHLGQAYDAPRYTLQFQTDAPIAIKSVFYIPQSHREKLGMGQQEPCVSLYSRKVLIMPKCADILPTWMRFVVGVVDSEDIPLNISREGMQDSALLRRMSATLSQKLLRFFAEQGKQEPKAYLSFYTEFAKFFKEGVCTDFTNQKDIVKLLRFESSALDAADQCSLDDYISRMTPEQGDKIYYLVTSSRAAAESSAYMEVFQKRGLEVLFCYQEIDDFVFQNAGTYEGKVLLSAAAADLELQEHPEGALSAEDAEALTVWMKNGPLVDKVSDVSTSARLVDSPAVINEAGGQSASMRRFMLMVDQSQAQNLPKQKLEVNPAHPIIKKLALMRTTDETLANLVAQQLFDNAMIGAGMLDDARPMLGRLNALMERSLAVVEDTTSAGS